MQKRETGITTTIFDIGGVTIDWDENIVYRHVEKQTRMPFGKIRKACLAQMKDFETGRTSEKEYWRRVSKAIGYPGNLQGTWLDHYGRHAKRNAAVIAAIRQARAKGYKTATITNVIKPYYTYNKKTGLYKNFNSVFASCNLKMRKPDKNIYLHALRRLNAKPGQCVFIDNLKENTATARKLGMKTILFKNAGQMKRELKLLDVKI